VILPAWTWYSCYSTVIQAGALPVFAEIDESFNIDPADIEHRIGTPQIAERGLTTESGAAGVTSRERERTRTGVCRTIKLDRFRPRGADRSSPTD
jgi:hypothetical protein